MLTPERIRVPNVRVKRAHAHLEKQWAEDRHFEFALIQEAAPIEEFYQP